MGLLFCAKDILIFAGKIYNVMKATDFNHSYIKPQVEELELKYTGIICTSPSAETEPLEEEYL